jgi:hypothetical protein
MRNRITSLSIAATITALLPASAGAATIDWTTWTTVNQGSPTGGSASGAAGGVGVTYSGEVLTPYNPVWTPTTTWADGTIIANAPPGGSQGYIGLQGGPGTGTDTITFSHSVTNPVMAIWSLGQSGITASLQFPGEAFTIVAGGPSSQYSGSSIVACGAGVCGNEGNGSIEFLGTFSSISFTTPNTEYWYGFNVGVAAPAPGTGPGAGLASLAGLALAGLFARTRRA